MLTKAQIELARDWNAAHYHPEHEHARTCDKALAAYERVVGLLESKVEAGCFGLLSAVAACERAAIAACAPPASGEVKP